MARMNIDEIIKLIPDVRSKYSKEQQAMYDEIISEGHETNWDAVDKFYPDKEKMIKRAAGDRDRKKEDRKKKSSKSPKRKPVKKCKCK
jgi:hypothetical protein